MIRSIIQFSQLPGYYVPVLWWTRLELLLRERVGSRHSPLFFAVETGQKIRRKYRHTNIIQIINMKGAAQAC